MGRLRGDLGVGTVSAHQIIILEEDVERINAALDDFLRETESKCALVIDRSGQLITSRGVQPTMDIQALSALAAGAFASTSEIARLVGETEFTVLFHQGKKEHIHVSLVDEHTLMMALFDDRATIGMVRLYARDAEQQIRRRLAISRARDTAKVAALDGFDPERLPDLFGEPSRG